MKIEVRTQSVLSPIYIERGIHQRLQDFIDTDKPTLVVSDSQIPDKWVQAVLAQLPKGSLHRFPAGEQSKNIAEWTRILESMAAIPLSRKDQVIALGGGVTGDMAGFAAACYMRGISFINIPTTVLSQVDSSAGGKTAIDLGSAKNIIGAFWQPACVLIDPDLLSTLPERQIANGLAEALKMGLLFDAGLVEEFEKEEPDIDAIIARSIALKADVVEKDEREAGLRSALNFGHTLGHAIEGSFEQFEYLHGECVALGMLYFLDDPQLKQRVIAIEEKLGLPKITAFDHQKAASLLRLDKKGAGETVKVVRVPKAGEFVMESLPWKEAASLLETDPYAIGIKNHEERKGQ